jgi:TldD protein
VDYADARVVHVVAEEFAVVTGAVDTVAADETCGIGIRVVVDGAMGFAATHDLRPGAVDAAVGRAVAIARAAAPRQRLHLGERSPVRGSYRTPVVLDPAAVSIEDKLGRLLAADAAARTVDGVTATRVNLAWRRERKLYADTTGSLIEQELAGIGAGLEVYARDDDDVQRRSYPEARGGQWQGAGLEFVDALDLTGNAVRCAEEAVALLSAPVCPAGERTVILDPSQLYMQIHESCGHATELDRVLGDEAAYAGTSFLDPAGVGHYRYGSELVTLVADATELGGLGTFGWDDEGTPAQRYPLIAAGVLTGFLSSRATAGELGGSSGGTVRAESWNRLPMIRMTNVSLQPVPGMALEEIVADTDDGLYLATNKSWSIDDRRWNFRFGTEVAYEIRHGRRGRLFKNATYSGITPRFWAGCDAVADERSYQLFGTPNCAKGMPPQAGFVGHGSSGARFRGVKVGSA